MVFATHYPLQAKLPKENHKLIRWGNPKAWSPLRLMACRLIQEGGGWPPRDAIMAIHEAREAYDEGVWEPIVSP